MTSDGFYIKNSVIYKNDSSSNKNHEIFDFKKYTNNIYIRIFLRLIYVYIVDADTTIHISKNIEFYKLYSSTKLIHAGIWKTIESSVGVDTKELDMEGAFEHKYKKFITCFLTLNSNELDENTRLEISDIESKIYRNFVFAKFLSGSKVVILYGSFDDVSKKFTIEKTILLNDLMYHRPMIYKTALTYAGYT